jgi:hypothetical protein
MIRKLRWNILYLVLAAVIALTVVGVPWLVDRHLAAGRNQIVTIAKSEGP